jgi:hypothetical protein
MSDNFENTITDLEREGLTRIAHGLFQVIVQIVSLFGVKLRATLWKL